VDRWPTSLANGWAFLTFCPAYIYFDRLHPLARWPHCEGGEAAEELTPA
jgi:hypothetical protein